MATVPITIRVSEEIASKLETLAAENGIKKEAFAKQIFEKIENGSIDIVILEPENTVAIAKLETKIEVLESQNSKLQSQLIDASKEGSLAGFSNKTESVTAQINRANQAFIDNFEKEQTRKEIEQLRLENAEHKKGLEGFEQRYNDEAAQERMLKTASMVADIAVKVVPNLSNKIGALMGLEPTNTLNGLDPNDMECLEMGKELQKAFEQHGGQAKIMAVIKYYQANPNILNSFVQSPQVAAYF